MAQANTHLEHTAPAIPIARGGPVTTEALLNILPAARRASTYEEPLDIALGEFMIAAYAPIVQELIQRRRAMEVIQDMASPDNVIFLSPGEDA